MSEQETIVILGAGVVSLSIAFYLSYPHFSASSLPNQTSLPPKIHVIDPTPSLYTSASTTASANAAGFLSSSWFSKELLPLAKLSFAEHVRLAKEHGGKDDWGFMTTRAVKLKLKLKKEVVKKENREGKEETEKEEDEEEEDWIKVGHGSRASASTSRPKVEVGNRPDWLLEEDGDHFESISEEGETAQIDPLRFCRRILDALFQNPDFTLHNPAYGISITPSTPDEKPSIQIRYIQKNITTNLAYDHLLLAAGPWTPSVFRTLFPTSKLQIPISSLAGYSIVIPRPDKPKEENEEQMSHAVFAVAQQTLEDGRLFSPELYERKGVAGREVYISGLNCPSLPLPSAATTQPIHANPIDELECVAVMYMNLPEISIVRQSLCFRPMSDRGTPIMGRIKDIDLRRESEDYVGKGKVWIASGHGPWGISLSLGTGIVMAEMIMGEKTSIDVNEFAL